MRISVSSNRILEFWRRNGLHWVVNLEFVAGPVKEGFQGDESQPCFCNL